MNSRVLLFLLACALATVLRAQDLPAELLPTAMKYRADTAALETQKTTEIARVAQVYGAALEAAEKMETTAGHLTALTAIGQERDDLKKDAVKPDPPGDLPKGLHTARKSYLDGVARVIGDFGQREQRIATDYVRALSDMQTRVGGNAALARQITDEKQRVLKSTPVGSTADIAHVFADSKWGGVGGGGGASFTLHADGSVSSTWGGRGKWKVLSPTRFEMHWDNSKPQLWVIDRAARIMTLDEGASRWERQ